jgi:MFS family permease
VPGGIIVDATSSKRLIAALATGAISISALLLAVWPIFPLVLFAEIFHGLASCLLGPAIAAISLGLVDYAAIGERLGRNASFASIGNGIAAALMGAWGRFSSARAVFFLTAALAVPALAALSYIRPADIDLVRARGGHPDGHRRTLKAQLHGVADNRPLLIFCACILLFQLANAAMLPFLGSILTMHSGRWATALIAACIVVPQIVVAILSPWVGRRAEAWGRRPLLLLGFTALPIRGIMFAFISNPYLLVAVQILDGVSAAVLGVMLPLVVADATRGTGHFNAALGVVGTASGIGASISSTLAGYLFYKFGSGTAFLCLAGLALIGAVLISCLMPETRDLAPVTSKEE